MKFHELLERYKNNTATEEEIRLVEEELEKNELINDYLSEHLLENLNEKKESEEAASVAESQSIKKAVDRKFLKIVVVSVAAAALLFGALKFVALPLYDKAFYNPNEGYTSEWNSALFLDVCAVTELWFPGYITSFAQAESLGMGKYDITISLWNSFNGGDEVFTNRLVRGRLEKTPSDFWHFPISNAFYERNSSDVVVETDGTESQWVQTEEEKSYYLDELKKLPETTEASVFFSFQEDIPLADYCERVKEYDNLYFNWVAVRSNNKPYHGNPIGFSPSSSGVIIEEGTLPVAEYPCFELANCDFNTDLGGYSSQDLETHFKTLLKYASQRQDFLSAFCAVNAAGSGNNYLDILDYVEKNGIKTYGVLVHGNRDAILDFAKEDIIHTIFINNVKLSKLSK